MYRHGMTAESRNSEYVMDAFSTEYQDYEAVKASIIKKTIAASQSEVERWDPK